MWTSEEAASADRAAPAAEEHPEAPPVPPAYCGRERHDGAPI